MYSQQLKVTASILSTMVSFAKKGHFHDSASINILINHHVPLGNLPLSSTFSQWSMIFCHIWWICKALSQLLVGVFELIE